MGTLLEPIRKCPWKNFISYDQYPRIKSKISMVVFDRSINNDSAVDSLIHGFLDLKHLEVYGLSGFNFEIFSCRVFAACGLLRTKSNFVIAR